MRSPVHHEEQRVVDQLWRGLVGLVKSRKIVTYAGTGSLGPEHTVTVAGTCSTVA